MVEVLEALNNSKNLLFWSKLIHCYLPTMERTWNLVLWWTHMLYMSARPWLYEWYLFQCNFLHYFDIWYSRNWLAEGKHRHAILVGISVSDMDTSLIWSNMCLTYLFIFWDTKYPCRTSLAPFLITPAPFLTWCSRVSLSCVAFTWGRESMISKE